MNGTKTTDVTITSITDLSTVSAAFEAIREVVHPLSSSSGVVAAYTVKADIGTLGFTNVTLAYNKLTAQLVQSVSRGKFTRTLQSLAAENGVSALTNATSTSVSTINVSPTYAPTHAPTKPSAESKSKIDELVATNWFLPVIISVGGSLVLLLLYCVLTRCRSQHESRTIQQHQQQASLQAAITNTFSFGHDGSSGGQKALRMNHILLEEEGTSGIHGTYML
jgi:hypothetical protein